MKRKSKKKPERRISVPTSDFFTSLREFYRDAERRESEKLAGRKTGRKEPVSEGLALCWDRNPPRYKGLRIELTGHFDARGMSNIYGRGDGFGRGMFNMDIWTTRGGRVLARFWSRKDEVDWESYEIFGLKVAPPEVTAELGHWDRNVPEALREAYDNWIEANF